MRSGAVHQVAEDGVGEAPINTAIADELDRYPDYATAIALPGLRWSQKINIVCEGRENVSAELTFVRKLVGSFF